jgi:hypothetical protein
MKRQHLVEQGGHVRVRGMHLVDDEEQSRERGRAEVRVAHDERREQHLIDRSDDDRAGEETFGVLGRPRAMSVASVRPQELELREGLSFLVVDSEVARHGEHHRRSIVLRPRRERRLNGANDALVDLGGRGSGREREVEAVDRARPEELGEAMNRGFGLA